MAYWSGLSVWASGTYRQAWDVHGTVSFFASVCLCVWAFLSGRATGWHGILTTTAHSDQNKPHFFFTTLAHGGAIREKNEGTRSSASRSHCKYSRLTLKEADLCRCQKFVMFLIVSRMLSLWLSSGSKMVCLFSTANIYIIACHFYPKVSLLSYSCLILQFIWSTLASDVNQEVLTRFYLADHFLQI